MKCPYCSYDKTRVVDKRETSDLSVNRRRRDCLRCGKRFTTYEKVEAESLIKKIRKRDGRIVPFQKEKITDCIFKAAQAVGGKDRTIAERLSDEVVELLEKRFAGKIPHVDDIQDAVEKVLVENGYYRTAKAYILYRKQRDDIRNTKAFLERAQNVIDDYIGQSDWRVKENANVDFSIAGLQSHISGRIIAEYTLNNIYPKEVSEAHKNADFHIHDLGLGVFAAYCAGWSLRQLLEMGFGGVPGKVHAKPAKHFDAALAQIVSFFGTLQNEWAGAQAFSSFDTYLAPFVRYDKLGYKEVKQGIQELIYGINQTSRWGAQVPFTNLTLDWTVPEDLRDMTVVIGGKRLKDTYSDFQDEMDMINKAFCEVMIEGDRNGRIFTFPIPTYNITKDFKWNDGENVDLLFEMTAKYGSPYFQNFINSSLKPGDVRSMCCRLQLNLKELRMKTGGLFGSGEKTGSVGVVTINMPKIGFLSKNEEEYFERLERLMIIAKESLEIKRKEVEKNMKRGLLPWTSVYLENLDHHFSTIGLIGMHESCLNFLNVGIETKEGKKFALQVLEFMRKKLVEFQEETGHIYNLEATPGEGTSYRLAKIDKKKHPNIITSGTKERPYYTNSTHLPVNYTDDIFEALLHQDELQTKYTGGTVFHGFVGERISSIEACKKLVKKIAYNFRLPYYTITPTFSVCPNHGYIAGENWTCPQCGKTCEVFSRVVGYFRPVKNWNLGKQEEFKERKTYNEKISLAHPMPK
ncbi:MAG TPA: ribonucleoside triphosphate reductase [Candidatus Desulfofervidus auxilii]|uniref:Ribonucleoside triphosphate reductase n=1 Tax=Desulfofervidus auxilii TaxID=1621989 RepID=A0A7V0I9H8_DESA2|nr:ribonucleoside triphosphate reductase [Candidatus Desulfofervidus auxilii]